MISKVEIGENKETEGIGTLAIDALPQKIIDAQSVEVDVVAGATITSQAILEAVKKALSGETNDQAAEVVLPFEKPDVIVVGAGIAGLTASVKAAELGANVLVLEQAARVGGSGNLARRLHRGRGHHH